MIGTESTGVSRALLAAAHRRVCLPQNGFADSLNASVAAALALQTALQLYGHAACGDYAREAEPAELCALRCRWIKELARDETQEQQMLERVAAFGAPRPLDDLRRHDDFREHTGRPTRTQRRAARNAVQ